MISPTRLFTAGMAIVMLSAPHSYATDAVDAFHRKYRSLSSMRMNFAGSDGISGTIAAKRGGQYRIDIAGRTIICDGKTVWSADASTRSVVVNEYKPLSTDVSLERVFFEIISVYRSQIVQSNSRSTVLRLTAPQPAAVIANVSALDVTLDASFNVTSVSIASGPSRVTYTISRFKRNPVISTSTFRYSAPKGWEVIDLRGSD